MSGVQIPPPLPNFLHFLKFGYFSDNLDFNIYLFHLGFLYFDDKIILMKKIFLLIGIVFSLNANNLFAKEGESIDVEEVKKIGN